MYHRNHLVEQADPELWRIGTPAMTTRGFKDEEARATAHLIADVLDNPHNEAHVGAVRAKVHALTSRFPIYG